MLSSLRSLEELVNNTHQVLTVAWGPFLHASVFKICTVGHNLYLLISPFFNLKTSLYILSRYCLNLLKLQEILELFQGPDQMSPLLSSPVPPGTVLL